MPWVGALGAEEKIKRCGVKKRGRRSGGRRVKEGKGGIMWKEKVREENEKKN